MVMINIINHIYKIMAVIIITIKIKTNILLIINNLITLGIKMTLKASLLATKMSDKILLEKYF